MNVREEVKIMLGAKCMTITELAKRMSELSGKNYSQSLISHKIASESLRYNSCPTLSQSITGIPRSSSCLDMVDFPVPILPVIPMI